MIYILSSRISDAGFLSGEPISIHYLEDTADVSKERSEGGEARAYLAKEAHMTTCAQQHQNAIRSNELLIDKRTLCKHYTCLS